MALIITIGIILLIFIIAYAYIHKSQNELFSGDAIGAIGTVYNNNILNTSRLAVSKNVTIMGTLNIFPSGIISAINGTTVPTGWALCDGTQGTPDLRSSFVMGTNAQSVSQANNMPFTYMIRDINMPPHTHTVVVTDNTGWDTPRKVCSNSLKPTGGHSYWADPAIQGQTSSYPLYNTSGATSGTSGQQPITIMPPYYALMYIMKL